MAGPGVTDGELHDAVANVEWFAVRLKGVLKLSDKIGALRALLNAELEIRSRLVDLNREAEAVQAVVAQGDAARERLSNIAAELKQHDEAMARHRVETETHATSEAARIVAVARAEAKKLLDETHAAIAQEAAQQREEAQEHEQRIASEIAARRAELARINDAIAEAKAKIGVH